MDKSLLELRNKMKKKKPAFVRQDSYKRKRLPDTWRSPRGLHSKLRMNKKGNAKKVSPGFKSPVQVRGLSREGYVMHNVSTPSALAQLDKDKDAIIIAGAVGNKKRLQILAEAMKKGLHVMFVKDTEAYKNKLQQKFTDRLDMKKQTVQQKEEKKKEIENKAEKKGIDKLADEKPEQTAKEMTQEEKKEAENKEKEKVLIQPQ